VKNDWKKIWKIIWKKREKLTGIFCESLRKDKKTFFFIFSGLLRPFSSSSQAIIGGGGVPCSSNRN